MPEGETVAGYSAAEQMQRMAREVHESTQRERAALQRMQEIEREAERCWQQKSEMHQQELQSQRLEMEERLRQQMECMKSQMAWLSAVAAEERIREVYNDPAVQQAVSGRAMILLEELRQQEEALSGSGAQGSAFHGTGME